MNVIKSIGAILSGMITGALLSIGTDLLLEKTGIFPSVHQGVFIWWMLLLALIYRAIYTAVSGYVTAALAPQKPLRHTMILATIGVAVTIIGSIVNWDKSQAWYPVALILITIPCTWMGGIIYKRSKTIVFNP
jgi:hypothetical protein